MEGDEHYSEESCRDFIIYELGHLYGIPQGFRYAQGIDQVRTRLMLRYGDANLDRAMGIFNEILEDDSTTGLGDEGDVWRSWRHSYLHCHVIYPLLPYIAFYSHSPLGRPIQPRDASILWTRPTTAEATCKSRHQNRLQIEEISHFSDGECTRSTGN